MNDRYVQTDLPVPPALPALMSSNSPHKPRSMKPLFWSVAILIGLTVMCSGGIMALLKSRKGLEEPTRSFLRLFQQGKYEDAYDLWASDAFKDFEPKEKTIETLEMSAGILGELQSFTPGEFRIRNYLGKPSQGYIEYAAEFNQGKCQIIFTLQQEDGQWKINSFKFNSELFNDYMRQKVQEDKEKATMSSKDEESEVASDKSAQLE